MAEPKESGIEKTVKIFIASSSELQTERDRLVLIINSINKNFQHLKIEPTMWETDIAGGSFPKERIQDEINCLLLKCSIALVLFYSKVGNFTLEELQLAMSEEKKVFVYFKTGFSSKTIEESDKHRKVLELRQQLEQGQQALLYKDYDNIDKFEALIRTDLQLYLTQKFPGAQKEKITEFDEYRLNIRRVEVNQSAATGEPLLEKTIDHLDDKQLVSGDPTQGLRDPGLGLPDPGQDLADRIMDPGDRI